LKFTEELLKAYAAPLSVTEDKKCHNAIDMVREALKALGFTDDSKPITKMLTETYAYTLEMRNVTLGRNVKIFIQGSYANDTNVRTESDVDIAVVQEDTFTPIYRAGVTGSNYGFIDAPVPAKSFKNEVQECLVYKFGPDVERKNKSIKVYGNTYRKDADTVPCQRHRDYRNDFHNNADNYIGGIVITADDGERIRNYPEQHIVNGRKKNTDTNYYYKKMVRIIKKMRYIMEDWKYPSVKNVSSFGLESLLWNLPNDVFMRYSTYRYLFDEIVKYLNDNTATLALYKEANGIKQLCPHQSNVDNYKKFILDLKGFYQYDI
jgi:hypothetical protein